MTFANPPCGPVHVRNFRFPASRMHLKDDVLAFPVASFQHIANLAHMPRQRTLITTRHVLFDKFTEPHRLPPVLSWVMGNSLRAGAQPKCGAGSWHTHAPHGVDLQSIRHTPP